MIEIPERVKDALRDGRMRKNYRFNVLKDDGTLDFAIENENLVSESVKYDERMCSGSQIKFGLCEGSSLEFQYFDKPNINGKQLQTFIDVQYIDEAYTYENVLQFSKYLIENVETAGKYRVYCATQNGFDYVWLGRGGSSTQYTPTVDDNGTYFVIDCEAGDSLEVEWEGHVYDTFLQSMTPIYVESTYTIPMGFFTVAQCPVQFATGIRKVTAYNKLQSGYLDQKANELLLNDFDGDGTISLTLYDIQKHLLANYEIVERPKEGIPLAETTASPVLSFGNAGYFSKDDDIDTPLSAYEYQTFTETQSSVVGVRPEIYSQCKGAMVTTSAGQYWEVVFLKGNIDTFVDNLLNYVADIFENAQFWSTSTGGYYTRAELLAIAKSFIEFWIKIDSTTYNLMDNPSETLESINNLVHNGAHTITIAVPRDIGFVKYSPSMVVGKCLDLTAPYEYTYTEKIDDQHSRVITKTLIPDIEFSDGSIYDGTISEMFAVNVIQLSDAEKINFVIESMPDFTLRDIVGANYETVCQFGKLDRVTDLFSGVELNTAALLPRDDLYPANDLYPGGLMDRSIKSAYSKLWTDTVGEQTFRNLIIKYKGLDENQQEKEFELQRTVDANGTTDYYMSDNWLFKNLVWTAEQIGTYADAMVAKMQGVKWFPFELWGAGLPYLETGDEIEIITADGSYTSYILQRQLSGIQNLQDTYINGELDIF